MDPARLQNGMSDNACVQDPVNVDTEAEGSLEAAGDASTGAVDPSSIAVVTTKRIVLVGDSLAQGLGPALAAIARDVPCAFHALGKQSTRVQDWMRDRILVDAI